MFKIFYSKKFLLVAISFIFIIFVFTREENIDPFPKEVISDNLITVRAAKTSTADNNRGDCQNNLSDWNIFKDEIEIRSASLQRDRVRVYKSKCFPRMQTKFCRHSLKIPLVERKCHSQEEMRFLTKEEADGRGLYMLTSFPGSGNTWLRLILEELSGIYTGSIYCDHLLAFSGHFGEGFPIRETIAVKAHHTSKGTTERIKFVMYIVRNPYHSVLSSISWKTTKSHTLSFRREKIDTAELRFEIDKWKRNINKWAGGGPKWSLTIISYDKLVSDFKTELQKIVKSLNFPVKKESIDCLLHNTMDAHQRNKEKGANPYSKEQESIIRQAILSLEDIWQSHNISYQEWVW